MFGFTTSEFNPKNLLQGQVNPDDEGVQSMMATQQEYLNGLTEVEGYVIQIQQQIKIEMDNLIQITMYFVNNPNPKIAVNGVEIL